MLQHAVPAICLNSHSGQHSIMLSGAHSTSSCLQMFINTNNDPLQYPGGFLCTRRHSCTAALLLGSCRRPAREGIASASAHRSCAFKKPAAAADDYYGIVVLEEKDKIVSLPSPCQLLKCTCSASSS